MLLRSFFSRRSFPLIVKFLSCKHIAIVANTGSMEPAMSGGDIAIYDYPPAAEHLKVGDVISFDLKFTRHGGATHRIIDIEKEEEGKEFHYFTKGDACDCQDRRFRTYDDIHQVMRGTIKLPSFLKPLLIEIVGQEMRELKESVKAKGQAAALRISKRLLPIA